MKLKISFLCVLLLFIFGCKKEYTSRYSLLPNTKSIEIAIGKNSRNISKCIQYIPGDSGDFLAIANNISNSVEIYDLNTTELYNEVFIKTEGEHSFYRNFGFILKTLDTLIVVSQNPQMIGIVNRNGEVMKVFSYSTDTKGNRVQMTTPYSVGAQGPVLNDSILYLGQFYRADNTNGVFTAELHKNSNLIVAVNLRTKKCQQMPLIYPEELIGRNIVGMYVRRVDGWNNCLVYIFSNVDGIFVTHDRIEFEKKVLETNYKLKLPDRDKKPINDVQAGMRFTISHDEIVDILYDIFRECYYVFIRRRTENVANELNIKYLFPDCFVLILDKNLKHMGEVFLEDNLYSFKMKFITREGLYISEDHVNNPSFSESFMKFRLFKLVESNRE